MPVGLVLLLLAWCSAPTRAFAAAALDLAALPSDDELARLVWQHAPDLIDARTRIESGRAAVDRSHLLPNPSLDGSMNTIPLGTTNPPGLDRWSDVPNYSVGISELFEVGKREPRQRAAQAALDASTQEARAALHERWFDVLGRIGAVATAEIRVAALGDLVADAARLTDVEGKRAGQGDAPALDADRAALDAERLRSTLAQERQTLAAALLDCTRTVGLPCEPFRDPQRAAGFIAAHLATGSAPALEERPDLQALQARADGARAALDLANARAMPDPSLRVGYTYDQFVAAGNQRNSLFVGVTVPLPVFDHGQADARQAVAELEGARDAHAVGLAQARTEVERLQRQVRDQLEHRRVLHERSVPLAQRVVGQLQQSLAAGGTTLQDLLLARRTLGELLLDTADADRAALDAALALARAEGVTPTVSRELGTPERR